MHSLFDARLLLRQSVYRSFYYHSYRFYLFLLSDMWLDLVRCQRTSGKQLRAEHPRARGLEPTLLSVTECDVVS